MAEQTETKSTCKTAAYEKLYDSIFAAIANPEDGEQHSFNEKYNMLQDSRIYSCERERRSRGESFARGGGEG